MSLRGKRVVVTRAEHQAESLMSLLREKGAIPLLYPCIAILPRHLNFDARDYDWLIVTSSNTAFALRGQHLNSIKIAAVGQSTASAIQEYLGKESDFVAEVQTAKALGESLPIQSGEHCLLPQSAIANAELPDILGKRGAIVDSIIAYDNHIGSGGEDIPNMLDSVDALTFTSGSCVKNFIERIAPKKALHLPAAVIGDSSATVAEVQGFQTIVPKVFTLEAMLEALEEYFS